MRKLILLPLLFVGCVHPGKSWPARAAYLACPETISLGVFVPEHELRNSHNSALFSVSATWQLRPFIPPAIPPTILPQ